MDTLENILVPTQHICSHASNCAAQKTSSIQNNLLILAIATYYREEEFLKRDGKRFDKNENQRKIGIQLSDGTHKK